jgi:hypothetical protein
MLMDKMLSSVAEVLDVSALPPRDIYLKNRCRTSQVCETVKRTLQKFQLLRGLFSWKDTPSVKPPFFINIDCLKNSFAG